MRSRPRARGVSWVPCPQTLWAWARTDRGWGLSERISCEKPGASFAPEEGGVPCAARPRARRYCAPGTACLEALGRGAQAQKALVEGSASVRQATCRSCRCGFWAALTRMPNDDRCPAGPGVQRGARSARKVGEKRWHGEGGAAASRSTGAGRVLALKWRTCPTSILSRLAFGRRDITQRRPFAAPAGPWRAATARGMDIAERGS